MVKIQLVHPLAKMPTRGSPASAGLDLTSVEDVEIPPTQRRLIDTGIRMCIEEGFYGRIAPRSGLAWKHGIDVLAGVIDRDYTLNVKVLLQNHGSDTFKVSVGDRIAQLIITKIDESEPIQVESIEETLRNGGFGSTGR